MRILLAILLSLGVCSAASASSGSPPPSGGHGGGGGTDALAPTHATVSLQCWANGVLLSHPALGDLPLCFDSGDVRSVTLLSLDAEGGVAEGGPPPAGGTEFEPAAECDDEEDDPKG